MPTPTLSLSPFHHHQIFIPNYNHVFVWFWFDFDSRKIHKPNEWYLMEQIPSKNLKFELSALRRSSFSESNQITLLFSNLCLRHCLACPPPYHIISIRTVCQPFDAIENFVWLCFVFRLFNCLKLLHSRRLYFFFPNLGADQIREIREIGQFTWKNNNQNSH